MSPAIHTEGLTDHCRRRTAVTGLDLDEPAGGVRWAFPWLPAATTVFVAAVHRRRRARRGP
ncbi:hypothetical protein [Actinophytocola sp.]|uniref:hypothetical protein n=1 Tax=Actinophytocola sp. TaxID=1872138 RepID=UPI002D2D9FDC|nr:hypothetical protein [Actinophytocola sp.]HYQ61741.1 hypothetical protein [Actinophytocola sp.]